MAKPPQPFRVRLNCVDHYQHAPTLSAGIFGPNAAASSTQRGQLPQVPIIRVFGATETGQKVCAHIHGALPYLYIRYPADSSLEKSQVDAYLATLRHAIDHALALSYRRNPYETLHARRNAAMFVAHISLVKAVPFFGYHVGYAHFCKIYLLNPAHMTRLADLLHQGAILKTVLQPYEAHLQYLLQWMCDFNLFGCGYISVAAPRFRGPVPSYEDLEEAEPEQEEVRHRWHDRSIPPSHISDSDRFPRLSHCPLEVDFHVAEILERTEIRARELHHSFIERLPSLSLSPDGVEEKLVHSMAGLWRDETRRRRRRMGLPSDPSPSDGKDAKSSPFPPEVLVSMSADPRNVSEGGWIHEAEYRAKVRELAAAECKVRSASGGGDEVTFEGFEEVLAGLQGEEGRAVQTVFESVEELFPATLEKRWRELRASGAEKASQEFGLFSQSWADVDMNVGEAVVDKQTIEDLQEQGREDEDLGSDEDVAKEKILTQRHQKSVATAAKGKATLRDAAESEASGAEIEAAPGGNPVPKRPAPASSQGPFKKAKLATTANNAPSQLRHNVTFRVKDVLPAGRPQTATGPPPDRPSIFYPGTAPPPAAQALDLERHGFDVPPSAQQPASQNSSQGTKLNFPVVKNPHDPDTALRLSQRSEGESGRALSRSVSPQKKQFFQHQHQQRPSPTKSDDTLRRSLGSLTKSGSQNSPPFPSPSKFAPLDPAKAENYHATFPVDGSKDTRTYLLNALPPTFDEILTTLDPAVIYQDAYYSNERDVPERPREYAGQEFRLYSTTLPYLQPFSADGAVHEVRVNTSAAEKHERKFREQRRARECRLRKWEIMEAPPGWDEVAAWVREEDAKKHSDRGKSAIQEPVAALKRKNRPAKELSQIEGPTQKNRHGFKFSQRKASTSVRHETGYMSTMSLEVHVNSRDDLAPDPERDPINLVVWCLADDQQVTDGSSTATAAMGIVFLAPENEDEATDRLAQLRRLAGPNVQVDLEDTELDLLNRLVDTVRALDPDILTGFEVHNSSWGYLIERARLHYEFNLPDEFSRVRAALSHGRFGKDADRWGFTHTSTVRITGRHTINIWRAMRAELNLLQYTFENVVFHLLHRRVPHYAFATLTQWYKSGRGRDLAKVLEYVTTRAQLDLEILAANELIPRTSEQARLLGVDFFSVFSRGSQYKVESLMFRIAKPESFLLVSPSRKQVGAQNALECLPLVMEPQSAFYSSPVLVLDFQSLYPSVMIAYNYCYSTCLGRITNWRGTNKMGFADFRRAPGLLELVQDKLNIAPNGMMYVRPEMRKSLLAKMLGEILETRVMVKSGMKVDRDDRTLQQLLNNRQLALKLIANVTYGYTSASFSGRMPCSEIADSIVQTGRETLEKAIAQIHAAHARWGAEVVYGDTDSLFLHLPGRTRADAFRIGAEIAREITAANPRPIKLKFEKVYHPCVLLAKKRYVGFKYESPSQTEPDFDAKGIETVRRDGTPAEQKIEEKALKILFRTADLSQVKRYFQAQCAKILTGRVSVQDFCFAKEVKLGTYADRGPPPPGALIATRRMLRDPRAEPQYGERVPYVVIAGAPGARLWERCVEPERLLDDPHAELDAEYYINKNLIPPLERIFNLVGANVRAWYDEMPKVQRIRALGGVGLSTKEGEGPLGGPAKNPRRTMESYMGISNCLACRAKLTAPTSGTTTTGGNGEPPLHPDLPLCRACRIVKPQATILTLRRRLQQAESKAAGLEEICRSCANLSWREPVRCDSRDCPVFYSRVKAATQLDVARSGLGGVLAVLEGEVAGRGREGLEW